MARRSGVESEAMDALSLRNGRIFLRGPRGALSIALDQGKRYYYLLSIVRVTEAMSN